MGCLKNKDYLYSKTKHEDSKNQNILLNAGLMLPIP